MNTKRLYVGTQNDGIFIIDQKPHPVPTDYIVPGGTTNVIATMADNDEEAARLAKLFTQAWTIPALREALEAARDKFSEYAELHRAKNTAAADEKAIHNAMMSGKMSAALSLLDTSETEKVDG